MSNFDDYFTNDDKPFAENLNDALLISNAFDFTIELELPRMFNGGEWIDTDSSRKAGVSIVTLLEKTNVVINSDSIKGTGTFKLKVYPNFNSFGNFKYIFWDGTGDIRCDVEDTKGTVIKSNVISSESLTALKGLKEYVFAFDLTNASLSNILLVMANKSQDRYGANVGISKVDGLESRLASIEETNVSQDRVLETKVDKVTGKGLSTNDYDNNAKNKVDSLKNVAITGSYDDVTDKPTIPSRTSQLTNDGDGTNAFVKNNDSRLTDNRTPKSHTHGNIGNEGTLNAANGIVVTDANKKISVTPTITKAKISDFPSTMPPSSHTHDDRYYTESEMDTKLNVKANSSHAHGSINSNGTLNSDISSVNNVVVTDSSNLVKTIAKLPFANLNITKANITGLGIPGQDTTYAVVNANANGLMSSSDKTKLDGISAGATKNIIDAALSSTSTNAVQNKVINSALAGKANSSHTHTKSQISDFSHTHDDRYYTESEMNTKLGLKQDKTGLAWNFIKLANDRIILYYNDYYCSLEINGSFTPSTKDSWTNLTGSTLDSAYRPTTPVTTLNDGDVLIRFKVNSEGTIQYYSPQTFSSASTLRAVLNWTRH